VIQRHGRSFHQASNRQRFDQRRYASIVYAVAAAAAAAAEFDEMASATFVGSWWWSSTRGHATKSTTPGTRVAYKYKHASPLSVAPHSTSFPSIMRPAGSRVAGRWASYLTVILAFVILPIIEQIVPRSTENYDKDKMCQNMSLHMINIY